MGKLIHTKAKRKGSELTPMSPKVWGSQGYSNSVVLPVLLGQEETEVQS